MGRPVLVVVAAAHVEQLGSIGGKGELSQFLSVIRRVVRELARLVSAAPADQMLRMPRTFSTQAHRSPFSEATRPLTNE